MQYLGDIFMIKNYFISILLISSITLAEDAKPSQQNIYRSHSGGSAMADILVKKDASIDNNSKAHVSLEKLPQEEQTEKLTSKRIYLSHSGGSASAQYVQKKNN